MEGPQDRQKAREQAAEAAQATKGDAEVCVQANAGRISIEENIVQLCRLARQ